VSVLERELYTILRIIKLCKHRRNGANWNTRQYDPLPWLRKVFATRDYATFARTFALCLPMQKDIMCRQYRLQVPWQSVTVLSPTFFNCELDAVTSKVQSLLHASQVPADICAFQARLPVLLKALFAFSSRADTCVTVATYTFSDLAPAPFPITPHCMPPPVPELTRDWGQYFFQWGGELGPCPSLIIHTIASVTLGISILALQVSLSTPACFANSHVLDNSHLQPLKPPTTISQALLHWLFFFVQVFLLQVLFSATCGTYHIHQSKTQLASVLTFAEARPGMHRPQRLVLVCKLDLGSNTGTFRRREYMHNGSSLDVWQLDLLSTGRRVTALVTAPHPHTDPQFTRRCQIAISIGSRAYKLRGNMHGHLIATFPTSPVQCDNPSVYWLATAPHMRISSHLACTLASEISTALCIFKSYAHMRDGATSFLCQPKCYVSMARLARRELDLGG
jgi:hypothetical protein